MKVGLTPATGSLGTVGPGSGFSQRDACVGNLFGHQDPEKVKNRKKKKASKGGTGGVVSVTRGAGSPAPFKRNRSDGSTSRELKKYRMEDDDRGYSRALADPNKLAIVTAEYPIVRLSEEQGRLSKLISRWPLMAFREMTMPAVICSDSKTALCALDGYLVRSREELRCRGLLGELARANSVSLLWVPRHSGVIGNEKADMLANRGAS